MIPFTYNTNPEKIAMPTTLRLTLGLLFALLLQTSAPTPATIAQTAPPFQMPFLGESGPSTWLLIQPYGNTITAYYWRYTTYDAGQGLHFGVDLAAPCNTPVVAIGDGTVIKVDAAEHGSAPHNLLISHANGYASFYGHLHYKPSVEVGDWVKAGDLVALSGDPDETCYSRPHLHLEIRNNKDYNIAYNPIPLIDADWDSLSLLGTHPDGFARDLYNPRRWQFLDDQPEVQFGGYLLNNYVNPWPLDWTR